MVLLGSKSFEMQNIFVNLSMESSGIRSGSKVKEVQNLAVLRMKTDKLRTKKFECSDLVRNLKPDDHSSGFSFLGSTIGIIILGIV
jgi:hypothetical protein